MNIAVHAGHAVVGSRGAVKYMDEVKKNRLIKKHMIKFLKKEKGVTVKDLTVHTGTQRQVLNGIKKNFSKRCKKGDWLNIKGDWLNISLHLNSSDNWRANGFEIWVSPKMFCDRSKRANLDAICAEFCERTGFENRGVKKSSSLFVLNHLPNCILFEVGFVTSRKDAKIYETRHSKRIACILADCVLKYGKELL